MDMDEVGKTPEQKFAGVDFQNFPTDFHTWGCPVFVLESPLQGGPSGLPKWEPRASTGVYLKHEPFHTGSLYLGLSTRTGHVSPQYHVVFDEKISTVDHMRKGTVPVNFKNQVEYHSELDMQ